MDGNQLKNTRIGKISGETSTYKLLLRRDGLIFRQDVETGEVEIFGDTDQEFKCVMSEETAKEFADSF